MKNSNKPKQGLTAPIKPPIRGAAREDQGSLSDWLDDVVEHSGEAENEALTRGGSTVREQQQHLESLSSSGLTDDEAPYELRNPLGVDRPKTRKKSTQISPARKKMREALNRGKGLTKKQSDSNAQYDYQQQNEQKQQNSDEVQAKDEAILRSLNGLAERLEHLGQHITNTPHQNTNPTASLPEQKAEPSTHETSKADDNITETLLAKVLQPFGSRLDDLAQRIETMSGSQPLEPSAQLSNPVPAFSTPPPPETYAHRPVPHDITDGLVDVRQKIRALSQESEGGLTAETLKARLNQIDNFQHNLAQVTQAVSQIHQRNVPLDLAPLQAQISDLRGLLEHGHEGENLKALEYRLDKLERLLDPLNDRLADMQGHLSKGSPEEYYRLEQMILELSSMFEPVSQRFDTLEQNFGESHQSFINNFSNLRQKLSSSDQRFADLEAQLNGLNSRLDKPLPADPRMVKGFHEKLDDLQHSLNAADQRLSVLGSFENSLRDMVDLLERSTSAASDVAEKVANKVIDSHKQTDEDRTQAMIKPISEVIESINVLRNDVHENDRQVNDHFEQLVTGLNNVNEQISEARASQAEFEAFEQARLEADQHQVNTTQAQQDYVEEQGADYHRSGQAQPARRPRRRKAKKRGLVDRLMGKSQEDNQTSLDADLVKEAKMRADHASRNEEEPMARGKKKKHKKKASSPLFRTVLYLVAFGLIAWLFVTQSGLDTKKLIRNLAALTNIVTNTQTFSQSVNQTDPLQNKVEIASANGQGFAAPKATLHSEPTTQQNVNQLLAEQVPNAGVQVVALAEPSSQMITIPTTRNDVMTTASLRTDEIGLPLPIPRREMQKASIISPHAEVSVSPGLPTVSLNLLTGKLRSALQNQDPNAMLEVGKRYSEGLHTETNWKKAAAWFRLAADLGLTVGYYEYAKALEYNASSSEDIQQAYAYYQKAAEAKNTKAIQALAMGYAKGLFSEKNPTKAAEWFKEAARYGVIDGQFNYAVLLSRGVGIPQDTVEAYKWFALAALAGDKEARERQHGLAVMMSPEAIREAEDRVSKWRALPTDTVANQAIAPPGGW